MSTIGPVFTPVRRTAADPSKHVHHVLGMVLGADPLTQEFTYLSERDRWLVRDLLGSGTAWGLSLSRRTGDRGPEVVVSPGVAVSPRGQLIRVTGAQRATLDDWLAAHGAEVDASQGSPPLNALTLHVVLRYREGFTDSLPIPGEPYRTEDQTTVPSRIQDDFQLELRLEPPGQTEEDALRDFVKWLRLHLQPVSTGGTPLADFLQAIRQAVVQSLPPGSTPDYLTDASPPNPIPVPASNLPQYLRASFRLWITELRARWRPAFLDSAADVSSAALQASDAVLLGTLQLPLTRAPNEGPWRVASLEGIIIDEESRPYLAHLRILQEWLLAGAASGGTLGSWAPGLAAASDPAPADYRVVAAGTIPADPSATPQSYRRLRATRVETGLAGFTFDGFDPAQGGQYLVKAMLATAGALKAPSVTFAGLNETGFTLEVTDQGEPVRQDMLTRLRFVIEVCQFSLPPR
jgi:hypothetical protein